MSSTHDSHSAEQASRQAVSERQPHAILDAESRRLKALKIDRILALEHSRAYRILEIGCGSGWIAHYFATHQFLECEVFAVDSVDSRVVRDGFAFSLVSDTQLPFGDAAFDVVISNHVIEHVGDAREQRTHLSEMRRVLRPGGSAYIATPNRWAPVEPHYRLPLLSWLPPSWRSRYVRLTRRGYYYDCNPLDRRELERYFDAARLTSELVTAAAVREMVAIERPRGWAKKLLSHAPEWLIRRIPFIPTLTFRLSRT